MTAAAASGNALLDAHVRLIRDTADLVQRSGIPAWSWPRAGRDRHPGPAGHRRRRRPGQGGSPAADLTGGTAAPDLRPGGTQGWIRAAGVFAGHPVRIYTAIAKEEHP